MSTEHTPAPVTMTIHAQLDGWPIDLQVSAPPARLATYLLRLAELGYTPRGTAAPASPAPVLASQGPPACPIHGTAKAKAGRYGFYCSAKLPDGSYCNEKPV